MAIHHVQSLATKSNNQQGVATYAYRSGVEALECAKTLFVTATSKLPKRSSDLLRDSQQQVQHLYSKLRSLRTLLAQARYTFSDMRDQSKVVTEIEALQKKLTVSFVDACRVNQEMCENNAPEFWLKPTLKLVKQIKDALKSQCRRVESFSLVGKNDADELSCCMYLRLSGFTDDLGLDHGERFVCLSVSGTETAISVHHTMLLPGTFRPQRVYDGERQCIQQLQQLMASENCEVMAEKLPVPIRRVDVQNMGSSKYVQNVFLDEDEVILQLRPKANDKNLNKIQEQIITDLEGCSGCKVIVKRSQRENIWSLRVQFVNPKPAVGTKKLTQRQSQGLRMMGFSDEMIADFQTTWNKRT